MSGSLCAACHDPCGPDADLCIGCESEAIDAVEAQLVAEAQAGRRFHCPEHRYTPPDNSGFAFCPRCELCPSALRSASEASAS